jgi:hypothetical protein
MPARGKLCVVAAALMVLLTAAFSDASKRRAILITTLSDACNYVCEFALCAGDGPRPDVTVCAPAASADMVIQVQAATLGPFPGPPSQSGVTVNFRGTRIHLECVAKLSPCFPTCFIDADCTLNGPLSRCVDGTCQARLGCN